MDKLLAILATRRQHNSKGEQAFLDTYILPLVPQVLSNAKGEVIAYVVDNHNKDKQTNVMWTCHVDTMHRGKPDVLQQEVWMDIDNTAFVSEDCDCLGADDGAGVWLLLEMIEAKVEGTYVFFRGEEVGCWGSSAVAKECPEWIGTFTHAIAFDRRGISSIITHQRGERACSDAVANKLSDLFNMGHTCDPTGVYTDTAEFMDTIPECINISIGYDGEHSSRETLDVGYVLELRDSICAVDWDYVELPVVRDPSVHEYDSDNYWSRSSAWGTTTKTKTATILNQAGYFDVQDVPTYSQLAMASDYEIEDWVQGTEVENIAFLVSDLMEMIAGLRYELRLAEGTTDDTPFVFDDDIYDDLHLKAGV